MATSRIAKHPWGNLSYKEILQSSGLIETDWRTGKTGYNLAAILLFGRDDVIRSCAPGIVTDALLRRVSVNRYDDRKYIETNLIDQYDLLIEFICKHTNDPFVLIGDARVSVRSWIAREIVSNILAHREYSKAHISRLIINNEKIYTDNWNRPKMHGQLTLDNFTPSPKNPLISKFFMNIGYADQLGSGMRNLYYYSKLYSGKEPQLIEGDVFETIVPLPKMTNTPQVTPQDDPQDNPQDNKLNLVLESCDTPHTRDELQTITGIMDRKHFRNAILKPLLEAGKIRMTIPDKPNSRNQKYVKA
jgi:ATP-dependent DNA helicase RecG